MFTPKGRERRLRQQLRAELSILDISHPIDMTEVCQRLGEHRGLTIRLLAIRLEVPGPFGLWLRTSSADYIIYQQETTVLHQQHIIAHELGHLLAGHSSDDGDDAVWAELLPDVPPDLLRRALRRTHYDTDQERDAETVATLLLERAAVVSAVTSPGSSPRARRAQRSLGDRQDWL
ncbi:hypothetical protein [Saccharopolyspora tripterygii]